MPKFALEATPEEIAAVDPESGPWEVEIIHRLFHYAPNTDDEGNPLGFAYARNGDTITLQHYEDYVRGLKFGAFVDPATVFSDPTGEGPGDFTAREDLVVFVKEHKVDEIVAEAGSDPEMAQLLIDAENAYRPDKPRKGVISGLQAVIDAYLDPNTPAGATGPTLGDHAAAMMGGGAPFPGDENEDGPEDDSEEE